jgi:hypothetical protein
MHNRRRVAPPFLKPSRVPVAGSDQDANCAFGTSGGSWSLAIVRVLRPIELKYSLAARRTLSSPSLAFVAIRPMLTNRAFQGPVGNGGNGANSVEGDGRELAAKGSKAAVRQVCVTTQAPDGVAVTLSYVSKHGDRNFSGTLTAQVIYTLTNDNALRID